MSAKNAKRSAARSALLQQMMRDARAAGAESEDCDLVWRVVEGADAAAATAIGRRLDPLNPPLLNMLSLPLTSTRMSDCSRVALSRTSAEITRRAALDYLLPDSVDSMATLLAWKRSGQWPPSRGAIQVASTEIRDWAVSQPVRDSAKRLAPLVKALGERRVIDAASGGAATRIVVHGGGRYCSVAVRHGRFPRFTIERDNQVLRIFDPGHPSEIAITLARSLDLVSEQSLRVDEKPLRRFIAERVMERPVASNDRNSDMDTIRPRAAIHGPAAPTDPVFGSPADAASLDQWVSAVGNLRGMTQQRDPTVLKRRMLRWPLTALEAPTIIELAAETIRGDGPEHSFRQAILASTPVVIPAPLVASLFESEHVPAEWIADVRVPLPAITVLFGKSFMLPQRVRAAIPTSEIGSPDVLRYRTAACSLKHDAGWLGITYLAGLEDCLRSEALFIMTGEGDDVAGDVVLVPGDLNRSMLGPSARIIAAYVSTLRTTTLRGVRARPPRRELERADTETELRIVAIGPRTVSPLTAGHGAGHHRSHVRRGHWRRVRCGPRSDWHYEVRWIPPTSVGRSWTEGSDRVYILPFPDGI